MKRRLLLITLLGCTRIWAQSSFQPDTAWIHVNNVKALISADGRLFWDGQNGQFGIPDENGNLTISPIKSAGLWLGAIDPGGNLRGAVHTFDGSDDDFCPGMSTSDWTNTGPCVNSVFNRIWRITKEELVAFFIDQSDGQIEGNHPAIYAWPGRGNPHFAGILGFELPDVPAYDHLAPFFDTNGDEIYNPDDGDFPMRLHFGCTVDPYLAEEMLWFVFNDAIIHTTPGFSPLYFDVQCVVSAYACSADNLLGNTIYVEYYLINKSLEDYYDLHAGIYADLSLGCSNDDYIGSIPEYHTGYIYNSDNNDGGCSNQDGYGSNPPAVSVALLRQLTDPWLFEAEQGGVMPVFDLQSNEPPEKKHPENGTQYYYNLKSRWKDNSPLTFGGDGYMDGVPVNFVYPGNPSNPLEWSEVSTIQSPGKRGILISSGPVDIDTARSTRMAVSFSIIQQSYNNHLQNVQLLADSMSQIAIPYEYCFDGPPLPCSPIISSTVNYPKTVKTLVLFPNPTTEQIRYQCSDCNPVVLIIYDRIGRMVAQIDHPEEQGVIAIDQLFPGAYFLQMITIGGKVIVKPFIIANGNK